MRHRPLLLLVAAALALAATPPPARAQDTTYTTSPDRGSATGLYVHYFTLTRGDSTMGYALQGGPNAGSCANVWCALVPGTSAGSWGQSGGTFPSFSAAAHEIVRVWNIRHPGSVAPPPVTPPPDTTPSTPPPSPTPDTSVRTVRILPNPDGAVTAYEVWQGTTLLGRVVQAPARRWTATIAGQATPLSPVYATLTAAAERLALEHRTPSEPPPVVTPPTDTAHHRVDIFDTVRTTVTMPPDTLRPRVILPVDTVVMRVGDPPLALGVGDTVKIPIRVLPKCSCDTTSTTPPPSTPPPPSTSSTPELPRNMSAMDAMLASARASDTVTRPISDLVGKTLVPRVNAAGQRMCQRITYTTNAAGQRVENPETLVCPAAVLEAAAQRTTTP